MLIIMGAMSYMNNSLFGFTEDLTQEEKELVAGTLVKKTFERGSLINRNDDGCLGLLAVEEGQLRVYIVSDAGREVTLFRIDAGEVCVLSVSCLMDSIVFDVVIEAATDVCLQIIPVDVVHRLEEQNTLVGLYLYKTAAEKFSEVMWTMQQILFMKVDTRIAIYLWDESGRLDTDVISVTHDVIAHHIGSSREVVTRVIRYFEKEGILSPGRGKMTILNRNALKKLAYPEM